MSFISMNLYQINEGLFFKAFFCVMHKPFNQLQFGLLFTVYSFFKLTKKKQLGFKTRLLNKLLY